MRQVFYLELTVNAFQDKIKHMKLLVGLVAGLVLLNFTGLSQQESSEKPRYKTGYSAIMRLSRDIYNALPQKYKDMINPEPVFLETDVTPFVRLIEYPDEPKPMRAVFISVGFIDLVNNIAHAKAIDKIKKGYFEKYVLSLSQETGEKELKELPDLNNPKYWSEDILNSQLSYFNQMVGQVIAIKLAHHYLGQYKKYESKLKTPDGKYIPINNLLTESEWQAAVEHGSKNALDCGLGIDGIKALYDCFDKMPKRPEWAAYFIPDFVKVKNLKKDLERIEKRFFSE
jgi:hypothetical protein